MTETREPVLIDDEFVQHAHDARARLREESPVRRARFADGTEDWLVMRYEDGDRLSVERELELQMCGCPPTACSGTSPAEQAMVRVAPRSAR